MALIDRIAEFNDWPTDRKSALLMLVGLAGHLALAPVTYYIGKETDFLDINVFFWDILTGVALIFIMLILCVLSTHGQGDGRWTAYFIVLVYGGWIISTVYLRGIWATGYLAWLPIVVLLASMWFDAWIGLFAFIYACAGVAVLSIFSFYDLIPYGPIFIDRSIERELNVSWMSAILFPIGGIFVLAFGLATSASVLMKRQGVTLREEREALEHERKKLQKTQDLIRRYAPVQITEKILGDELVEEFEPKRLKLTIFFSDIVGFTKASDHLEPEELAEALNHYLSEMAEIAKQYGATINQYIGDAIMLFFGAPEATNDKDHAIRAVRMAIEMQHRLGELKEAWIEHGIRNPFQVRMGINTGYASVGDFGSDERKEYTAIGIQTNLAARIQDRCEPGKVLISDTTYALVKDKFKCEFKGEYELKGIHFPVKTYEVVEEK